MVSLQPQVHGSSSSSSSSSSHQVTLLLNKFRIKECFLNLGRVQVQTV